MALGLSSAGVAPMHRTKKLVFATIMATACAVHAQESSTDKLAAELMGRWSCIAIRPNVQVSGIVEFKRNGTFSLTSTIKNKRERPFQIVVEGTWSLDGNTLIEQITNSSNLDLAPVGTVTKDRVLIIDRTRLVYESESGEIFARLRAD